MRRALGNNHSSKDPTVLVEQSLQYQYLNTTLLPRATYMVSGTVGSSPCVESCYYYGSLLCSCSTYSYCLPPATPGFLFPWWQGSRGGGDLGESCVELAERSQEFFNNSIVQAVVVVVVVVVVVLKQ
jgi:hypothetical protein